MVILEKERLLNEIENRKKMKEKEDMIKDIKEKRKQ